jgi:hypothetical protein
MIDITVRTTCPQAKMSTKRWRKRSPPVIECQTKWIIAICRVVISKLSMVDNLCVMDSGEIYRVRACLLFDVIGLVPPAKP